MRQHLRQSVMIAIMFLAFSVNCLAGDLEPTAGPGPTMKPLSDIEPRIAINNINTPGVSGYTYEITASGSYYLTSNITLSGNGGAISIASDNVTIDLCGYEISNDYESNAYSGIYANDKNNITVRNGTVRGFRRGLYFFGSGTTDIKCYDLRASDNQSFGISVQGTSTATSTGGGSIVKNCIAAGNGDTGIYVRYSGVVEGCISRYNDGMGFYAGYSSVVKGCSAFGNTSSGFYIGDGGSIESCVSSGNAGNGIRAAYGCRIKGCTVRECTEEGISIYAGGVVEDNTSYSGDSYGIYTGYGCTVKGNSVRNNVTYGIFTGTGSVIKDNSVYGTTDGGGILAGVASTVIGNSCVSNDTYGIYCNSNCFINNNTSYNNTTNLYAVSCTSVDNHAP